MKPQSIAHLFFGACRTFDKIAAVMVKEQGAYRPYSHKFFRQRVSHFARGLIALGLKQDEHVAILAETRFEWAIADLGILCAGAVNVPIYPTLTGETLTWILENSESVGIVVSNQDQARKILAIRDQLPALRFLIMMENSPPEGFHSMKEIEVLGISLDNEDEFIRRHKARNSDHLLSIIYTSGTTGNPKGVMLTHGNMLANIFSCEEMMPFDSSDTHLSHLPLCHVLERMGGYYSMLYRGVTIAYAEDIKTVAENIMEVKPSLLVSVPRLFEKIYAKVMTNAQNSGFLKRKMFHWAMGVGAEAVPYFNENKPLPGWLGKKWALADSLVFTKVKEKTGGNLRFLFSGGAPLAKEIAEFFLGMGLKMVEGYGLTETSPVLSVNPPERNKPGTVGRPVPNVEIRIAEDGEILARGPNIMKGYYKNPAATAEVMEGDWFHTGDIGILDQDGFLQITDRKKDLLVTSGGKNIAPQPLENALKLSPYIEHAVVIGDNRAFITALLVPPWETVKDWASHENWPTDPETLVKYEPFLKKLEAEVHQRLASFSHYERVKKFAVLPQSFTVETGELTPSMKVKRKVVNNLHQERIEALYQ